MSHGGHSLHTGDYAKLAGGIALAAFAPEIIPMLGAGAGAGGTAAALGGADALGAGFGGAAGLGSLGSGFGAGAGLGDLGLGASEAAGISGAPFGTSPGALQPPTFMDQMQSFLKPGGSFNKGLNTMQKVSQLGKMTGIGQQPAAGAPPPMRPLGAQPAIASTAQILGNPNTAQIGGQSMMAGGQMNPQQLMQMLQMLRQQGVA